MTNQRKIDTFLTEKKNVQASTKNIKVKQKNHFETNGIWLNVKLDEVCVIVPGQHILSQDYTNSPKGSPYITGPADFSIKYPIITKWTLKPKAFAQPGDVLLTVKGAGVGKVNCAHPNLKTAIGRQVMALRPNLEYLDQEFLYYYLMYKFNYFQDIAQSATVPGIRKNQLRKFTLPIPSLNEQERIVTRIKELEEEFRERIELSNRIRSRLEHTRKDLESSLPIKLLYPINDILMTQRNRITNEIIAVQRDNIHEELSCFRDSLKIKQEIRKAKEQLIKEKHKMNILLE